MITLQDFGNHERPPIMTEQEQKLVQKLTRTVEAIQKDQLHTDAWLIALAGLFLTLESKQSGISMEEARDKLNLRQQEALQRLLEDLKNRNPGMTKP